MAGLNAQGATLTFNSATSGLYKFIASGVSIEAPEAEMTDMTSPGDLLGANVMVPTGDTSGGSMSVDFVATAGFLNPQAIVGERGLLTLSSPQYAVSRNVVLQGASVDSRVGDIVRGTMKFAITDYYG